MLEHVGDKEGASAIGTDCYRGYLIKTQVLPGYRRPGTPEVGSIVKCRVGSEQAWLKRGASSSDGQWQLGKADALQ